MITDITKTIKNVKIKTIQLHHSLDTDLSWNNVLYPSYSNIELANYIAGDADSDGDLTVLDIVQIVNHIIGEQNLHYSQYGDANEDGSVDVLDIVVIVNSILGD